MIAHVKKITIAIGVAAATLVAAAPAEAQRYRGGYYGHDRGDALIAGLAGIAVGTALAANAGRRYDGYYYDRGYDGPVVIYPPISYGYYGRPYPAYNYYPGYVGYSSYYYPRYRGSYDRGRFYGRGDRGGYGRGGRGDFRR